MRVYEKTTTFEPQYNKTTNPNCCAERRFHLSSTSYVKVARDDGGPRSEREREIVSMAGEHEAASKLQSLR